MKYHVSVDGQQYEIELGEEDGKDRVVFEGNDIGADLKLVNAPSLYSLLLNNHSYELLVEQRGEEYAVFLDTELYEVKVQDERALRLARVRGLAGRAEGEETEIKAPMPGMVVEVAVAAGDVVDKGAGLVILEAMKMENELRAPRAGTIKAVLAAKGDKVAQGQTLVMLG